MKSKSDYVKKEFVKEMERQLKEYTKNVIFIRKMGRLGNRKIKIINENKYTGRKKDVIFD